MVRGRDKTRPILSSAQLPWRTPILALAAAPIIGIPMGRLDRYVLKEIVGPLGLGFAVYTFILLLQFLFSSAEMIIRRGLPAAIVGKLVLFSLPNIVVLTIPMALLLGVLVGVGRLASDSELVAMRASGVSIYRLARPVLALAAVLTLLNGALMLYLLPRGNHAVSRLYLEILTRTIGQQVEPRVFYNEWQGKVLYVFGTADRDQDWRGVFLADAVPSDRQEIIVAKTGRLQVEEGGERVVLQLHDAIKHAFDFRSPKRYETSRHQTLRIVLRDRFLSSEREKLLQRKGPRELDLGELRALARSVETGPEQRRLARVGIQKMFAIPAACIVLGLLSLPLAFNNRHGGRSSGFALSIGIIVAYYVLLSQGEDAARVGKLGPAFAMWLPNMIFLVIGGTLLVLRDRDRSLLPRPLDRWLSARLAALRRRRMPKSGSSVPAERITASPEEAGLPLPRRRRVVLRVPRIRLRFPNLVDRYVLRRFASVLVLVWLSATALGAIADLTGNVDDILKNSPPTAVVARYYKFLILQMGYDIAPIAVLVTTLVTFSLLSRSNEVTALRSLGISLYRLSLPAIVGAAGLALLCTTLQISVLPASNQKLEEAKNIIRGRTKPRAARRADQQWLIGQGRFIYNYLSFDPGSQSFQRLQVFSFDDRHELVGRLYAATATHDVKGWQVADGWTRSFRGISETGFRAFTNPIAVDLDEAPSYFEAEVRKPSEMGFRELADYVSEVRDSGQPLPRLEVALQNRIAFPFASLVMAMVALPFAFRLERRGALYGLGVAVALGIAYMAVFALFRTLGEVGSFPAIVAVWSPNLVFGLLSAYLFLGVRS